MNFPNTMERSASAARDHLCLCFVHGQPAGSAGASAFGHNKRGQYLGRDTEVRLATYDAWTVHPSEPWRAV